MKILITGACGFLARVLTRQLEESPFGHTLHLMDRSRPEEATAFAPGSPERTSSPIEVHWPFFCGAVTDPNAVREAAAGMDAVIHLAAAVTGLPEAGVETFTDNAVGTYVVLDEARKAGISRALCASSINAFGTFYWRLSGREVEYQKMPLTEDFPAVPEDAYSLSKLVNEQTCAAFTRAYGMTTAAFRFAGVWSAAQYDERRRAGLTPTTAWAADLYSWVHIEDIAAGIVRALECSTLPQHGVYTLSAADTICAEPTMEVLSRFRPDLLASLDRPLVGREPLLSINRARNTFGYNPTYFLI